MLQWDQIGHFARHYKAKQNDHNKRNELLNMVGTSQASRNNRWCIDSGATAHMCPHVNVNFLHRFKNTRSSSRWPATNKIVATGTYGVSICINGVQITFQDVLFYPDLNMNFISISRVVDKGLKVSVM